MTTNPAVDRVTFLWKNPGGTTTYTDPDVAVFQNGTMWDGSLIYYAVSTYTPDLMGNWGVQALFQDEIGRTIQDI